MRRRWGVSPPVPPSEKCSWGAGKQPWEMLGLQDILVTHYGNSGAMGTFDRALAHASSAAYISGLLARATQATLRYNRLPKLFQSLSRSLRSCEDIFYQVEPDHNAGNWSLFFPPLSMPSYPSYWILLQNTRPKSSTRKKIQGRQYVSLSYFFSLCIENNYIPFPQLLPFNEL